MSSELKTMEEMLAQSRRTEEELIFFNDDDRFFRILPNGEPIEYESVSDPKKLLECVWMLSEKSWVNREHLCYLIRGLSMRLNLNLDRFAD